MRFRDLTGQTFSRLTALRRVENAPGYGQARWLFRCECGTEIVTFGYNVCHGRQRSCGCYHTDNPSRLRHGAAGTPEHSTWIHIRQRCGNKSNKRYSDYGGRGIKVCARWNVFENFLADMGERPPGMTIERIDNDGNYEPDNCRWASRREQVRNRRKSNPYTFHGKTQGLAYWADEKGLPYKVLWFRYSEMGWRGEKLFSPLREVARGSLRKPKT